MTFSGQDIAQMLMEKARFVSNFITLPREGGGMQAPISFSEMAAERLEFCTVLHSKVGIVRATFGKE